MSLQHCLETHRCRPGGTQRPDTLGPSPLAPCLVVLPGRSILHPHGLLMEALRAPRPTCSRRAGEQDAEARAEATPLARGGSPRLLPPASSPSAACQDPVPQVAGQGTAGIWCPAEGPCPAPAAHLVSGDHRCGHFLTSSAPCAWGAGHSGTRGGCPQPAGPSPRREPSPRLWIRDSAQASSWIRASGIRVLSVTNPGGIESAGERPLGWFRLCKA